MLYQSLEEMIGNTPLLHAQRVEAKYHTFASLYLKIEGSNPTGSAKDRCALAMITEAERTGQLCPGGTVIEETSGNTGIGLAAVCATRGYRCIIVMPDTMSLERQQLIRAYGAEVILTKGALGMEGAVAKAMELHRGIPGSIIAGQFDNPANPLSHYQTTGPEIYRDLSGKVDCFVAGIGTGGTISGVAKYLKEQNDNIQIVGVEPFSSPLLTKGISGAHGLQGIGANFVPANTNLALIDDIMTITDEEAYETARMLAKTEGILAGITSGAALVSAIRWSMRAENKGKNVVALMPDVGSRYLSCGLFDEDDGR